MAAVCFNIRYSEHEPCKAPASTRGASLLSASSGHGDATRASGYREPRLGQGDESRRASMRYDVFFEKKTPTKGVETVRSGHLGR